MLLLNDEEVELLTGYVGGALENSDDGELNQLYERLVNEGQPVGFGVVCSYEDSSRVSTYGFHQTREDAIDELIEVIEVECDGYDEDVVRDDELFIDEDEDRIFGIVEFN